MTYTERRKLIANDYLHGMSQPEIATKHGVDQSTISRDLEAVRREWMQSTLIDFDQAKARELAKIDDLEMIYRDAWKRSLGPKRKVRRERNTISIPLDDKNQVRFEIEADQDKVTVEREELLGNPAYLSGVQWCIEQRCKIFGIYEATKITFDWRKAIEEKGLDAGNIFEQLVNTYIAAINSGADGEDDR